MQLTNVLVMDLPDGRLRALVAPCRLTAARLPLSFDQRKHAGAGNRPGSWMALTLDLSSRDDLEFLPAAWDAVVRRHGTLRTAIVEENGGLALALTDVGPCTWQEVPREAGVDIRQMVRELFDEVCRPLATPSYRLLVVEPSDASLPPTVIIGADHSHVDAWSLLVLCRDLRAAIERGRDGVRDEPLPAPPFAAHSTELLCRPATPEHIIERWREILDTEGGIMPTFPLPLGDISTPKPERLEFRDILDAAGLHGLEQWCAQTHTRLIAAAILALTQASLRLSDRPLRAVLPVHSRFEPRWGESVGWFITNSVIECASTEPHACDDAVRSAITLGSHPLERIMRPYGGMPERPGMFALSWLDYRRLPVAVPADSNPKHVSAVIRTDGVMAWFVVTDTGLRVRVRYPDTPLAETNVGAWLDAVVEVLRSLAVGHDAVAEPSS